MNDNNLIKKLIQARTLEATKKGINGKLILIAKTYGSPIMGYYYDNPLVNEDWESFNNTVNDWSEVEEDEVVPKLGFVYDSLNIGVNLEIVVMMKEVLNYKTKKREFEKPTKVKCSYRGYEVYREEEGKLMCYAPFPEWEDHVEKIYNQAVGVDKNREKLEKEKELKIKKDAITKTLSTLRKLWGI